MLDRQARDIMRREVTTLRPDMTVREAIEVTRKRPHSTYPVVDEDWRILGVMQREDFHEFLGSAQANLESPLRDLSFVALPLVRGDVPVQQVMETIIRGGASKALVCDDNRVLQGIITLMDLVAEEKKSKAEMR
jgi:NADH dehydrogenase